jgi:hypothetical protein
VSGDAERQSAQAWLQDDEDEEGDTSLWASREGTEPDMPESEGRVPTSTSAEIVKEQTITGTQSSPECDFMRQQGFFLPLPDDTETEVGAEEGNEDWTILQRTENGIQDELIRRHGRCGWGYYLFELVVEDEVRCSLERACLSVLMCFLL